MLIATMQQKEWEFPTRPGFRVYDILTQKNRDCKLFLYYMFVTIMYYIIFLL